jgi:hypothetical protein
VHQRVGNAHRAIAANDEERLNAILPGAMQNGLRDVKDRDPTFKDSD